MEFNKLRVIVVGAGPGGLACAYKLQSRGFQVTIIERASLETIYADIGGAYDISENCRKTFHKMGLGNEFDALGGQMREFFLCDASGKVMKDVALNNPDVQLLALRRSELQKVFLNAIKPESLVCDSPLKSIEETSTCVRAILESGQQIEGDILVGADGIRSRVLAHLFPEEFESKLHFQHVACYWGFVDVNKVQDTDLFKPGVGYSVSGGTTIVGGGMHGQGNEMVWAVLNRVNGDPEHTVVKDTELWKEEVLNLTMDFKPKCIPKMLQDTEACSIMKVHVYDRDPLNSWSKGRCVLIGDAAHAMNPFAGQGANMAIIDGFLLGTMICSDLKQFTPGNVPLNNITTIFKDFEQIRKPSASRVLKQARKSADMLLSESAWKRWTFNTMMNLMPVSLLRVLMFKADEENGPALLSCGVQPAKVSLFGQ